jgi:chaperonin GroES
VGKLTKEEALMAVNVQPLADWVVAQPEEAVTKLSSGIYLTGKSAEKPMTAKVVKVGKNVREVKTGDKIVYKSYSTTELKLGGEYFVLVKEEDIIATVK